MYVHVGSGHMVAEEDILGIFDLDNLTSSPSGEDFLKLCEKEGRFLNICGQFDLPKSIIVTDWDGKTETILSPITSQTISKRRNPMAELEEFPEIE